MTPIDGHMLSMHMCRGVPVTGFCHVFQTVPRAGEGRHGTEEHPPWLL